MGALATRVVFIDGYAGSEVVFKAQFKGFDVLCPRGAKQLVDLLECGLVGALVVDPGWPTTKGLLEIARTRFPSVPCAIVTARDDIADEIRTSDAHVRVFMKPWTKAAIVEFVEEALWASRSMLDGRVTELPRAGSGLAVSKKKVAVSSG